jgi:hypothetical protein
MWPGNMGVPMQRQPNLGTRTELNDQEYAQAVARAKQQAASDAVDVGAPVEKATIGPPSYWTERGTPTRQTSLIVDPPDGRLPALTKVEETLRKEARGGRGFPGEWNGSHGSQHLLPLHHARPAGFHHPGGVQQRQPDSARARLCGVP